MSRRIGVAAIAAVGITPEAVFVGIGNIIIPVSESNVVRRAAKSSFDAAPIMTRADAFAGIIGAVVEIIGVALIGFPKRAVGGVQRGDFYGRINHGHIADHGAIHGVTGNLLGTLLVLAIRLRIGEGF